MKVTTLMDIYNCLKGRGGEEIFLPQNVMEGARRCIHRMVELGGWYIYKILLVIRKENWYNYMVAEWYHFVIIFVIIMIEKWYNDVRVKRHFAPNLISTNCSAAKQLPQFSNIRNPLIYCVNRYFLMFGGSQVQKSYRASTNNFLAFWPWYHIIVLTNIIIFCKRNRIVYCLYIIILWSVEWAVT